MGSSSLNKILFGVFIVFLALAALLTIKYYSISKNTNTTNLNPTKIVNSAYKFTSSIGTQEPISISTSNSDSNEYGITIIGKLKNSSVENGNYFFVLDSSIVNIPKVVKIDLGKANKVLFEQVYNLDDPNQVNSGYTGTLQKKTAAQLYSEFKSKLGTTFKFYILTKLTLDPNNPNCTDFCKEKIAEYNTYLPIENKIINQDPEIINNSEPIKIGSTNMYEVGVQ